jgi:epoxyqueuosine reductase
MKESLKKLAKKYLIDYIGVAPVERMSNAPIGSRPTDILSSAKSIISLGVKLLAGTTYTNKKAYNGHNMVIAVYMRFGMQFLNDVLDTAAYSINRELSDMGFLTVQIPAAHPYPYINKVIFGKNHENVNLFSNRHAAVAAGLGQFGWNSLLITPDGGPRVRCATLITEAEIEPDPMYSGEPICKGENCPEPLKCAKICPMGAISLTESRTLEMDGRIFSYGEVDFTKCIWGSLGLRKATLGKVDCYMPDERTPEALSQAILEEDPMERQERFGNANMCGRCIIECPIGNSNL